MTYLGAALKRRLYPTVLCYHGCVSRRDQVLVFREALGDVKSHVRMMQAAGYRIVKPSEYRAWRLGTMSFDQPVTCIHFDDGLASIELVVPWLIEQGIPCGLALITRRLGVRDPEQDFLSWTRIREWLATGLVEIMSHTHNMHHLTLLPQAGGGVDVGPVLEGPCWIDDGDVVYREADDDRWYWDFAHVDQVTLGLPLWGTDPYDEVTPIVTTVRITPKASGTVTLLRMWMSLSRPDGSGYDAQVQIRVDGTLVFDGVIAPKQYETRAQWVEREFYSLQLDTPFEITSGAPIDMEWRTLNAGVGAASIYAMPTREDAAFRAVTNCRGLFKEGSQGAPNKGWQYIDYPAGDRWPVKVAMVLAFGTGRSATDVEYQGYIAADCAAFNSAVSSWPRANWAESLLWIGDSVDNAWPVGWKNPERVRAVIPLANVDITARYLRIRMGQPENFRGGDVDPYDFVGMDAFKPYEDALAEASTRSYSATFDCYIASPVNVTRPAVYPDALDYVSLQLTAGEQLLHMVQVRDELHREYVAVPALEYDPISGLRLPLPPFSYYRSQVVPAILISEEARGLEVTVSMSLLQLTDGGNVARAAIWRISKNVTQEISPTWLGGEEQRYLVLDPINGGPTVGPEQHCRWGVREVKAGFVSSYSGPAVDVDQIVYPFGSYYAGTVEVRPGYQDVHPMLVGAFSAAGLDHGYTIAAYRNLQASESREPDLRRTQWALGRWLIYGDQAPEVSRNNLAAYSGMLYHDVRHRGVEWQVSIEADPLGNATVRRRPQVLDHVAFDAYWFDGAGGIQPAAINDGGTYSGTPYADDKGWLQARGVRCLLIINNNLGTGDPDPAIGSHVVNNPSTYIPLIVALTTDDGWDGITCNLEAVPATDRAAATAFYVQLARAMHAAGKVLHVTAPAITGTDYDAVDYWTGWCDLGAIAKVADAVKVMSYTESGAWSEPGPAAPTWFWDAAYAYVRRVVPEPYWPRILCGARMFGHMWDTEAPGEADYISYHRAIAEALTYGKRIDTRDTEAGWSNGRFSAWCGTPATVDRAQREAAQSFGGIGLWKADDGDIEEFFPLTRQIGRDEDMSFMDVRFPVDVSSGSSGGPMFSTSVIETQSGDTARNARWTMPMHRFDASMAIRRQPQWERVRALFMNARGRWRSFRYKDWADFKLVDQLIGTGDGTQTTFQLVKTYAFESHVFTRLITKPVAHTITVKANGTPVSGAAWTINDGTGLLSFFTPPAAAVQIAVSGEFDVQVRFDVDSLPAEGLFTKPNGDIMFDAGTVPLIEVRA